MNISSRIIIEKSRNFLRTQEEEEDKIKSNRKRKGK